LLSKELYAKELEEQMVARSIQQAQEASRQQPHVVNGGDDLTDALDEVLLGGRGRRKGGPARLPAKSLYAAELKQQIAEREAQQSSHPEIPSTGFPGGEFSVQAEESTRGRRHASKIDPVNSSMLNIALQEQMAERAAQRAASAFHVQVGASAQDIGTGLDALLSTEPESAKGRRKCDLPVHSKQSYALALQEQIARRKAKNGFLPKVPEQSSFVGGRTSDMEQARGRRHAGQIVPPSKEELRLDLQRQIAEHANKEAATKPFARSPAALCEEHNGVDTEGDALEILLGAHTGHVSGQC
jgi:hypothetical protein